MEYLQSLGKKEGLKKLAEHEQRGSLKEFIEEVAPSFVTNGEVDKFLLLKALGW